MANIHESHKTCVICGKEFVTNFDSKITCSATCAKKRENILAKENADHYKALARKRYRKKKIATEKKRITAEGAHKLRMQRQREARELGLSYAQYIAQKGIKEI